MVKNAASLPYRRQMIQHEAAMLGSGGVLPSQAGTWLQSCCRAPEKAPGRSSAAPRASKTGAPISIVAARELSSWSKRCRCCLTWPSRPLISACASWS